MYNQERTKYLFEIIEGYPEPIKLPESAFNYSKELEEFNPAQRFIRKLFLKLSTFEKFNNNLHNNFENLARTIDLKSSALFGPVVSASICIKNESGNTKYVDRAARLILAVKDTYEDIISAKFPPDKYGNNVLEMGQYPNIFSTTQIIEKNKVRIFKSKKTSQITVIIDGKYYLLSLDKLMSENSVSQIKHALKLIIADSKQNSDKGKYFSPGEITATPNKLQRNLFKEIIKIDENTQSLNKIKHSLFTLCLDVNDIPNGYSETTKITHSKNYSNRWFHSSFQLVVFGNANVGILINFSNYIGGNNMMRIGEELYGRALEYKNDKRDEKSNATTLDFERINWNINLTWLEKSRVVIKRIIDNQEASFEIQSLGEKDFNQKNIDAVPAFVIALQLTARNYVETTPRIKQFFTMSKYRCMDLLVANVTTEEVISFTDHIRNKILSKEEYSERLKAAIKSIIDESRRHRKHYPLSNQMSLFLNSLSGMKKYLLSSLNILSLVLIKNMGKKDKFQNDIMISHPKIYNKVPIIGRPGIKIPYVKYFGLHYQIFNEKIVITMMPGLNWNVPNKEFIKALEKNLLKILEIA